GAHGVSAPASDPVDTGGRARRQGAGSGVEPHAARAVELPNGPLRGRAGGAALRGLTYCPPVKRLLTACSLLAACTPAPEPDVPSNDAPQPSTAPPEASAEGHEGHHHAHHHG